MQSFIIVVSTDALHGNKKLVICQRSTEHMTSMNIPYSSIHPVPVCTKDIFQNANPQKLTFITYLYLQDDQIHHPQIQFHLGTQTLHSIHLHQMSSTQDSLKH
jgi:hypothetical protein